VVVDVNVSYDINNYQKKTIHIKVEKMMKDITSPQWRSLSTPPHSCATCSISNTLDDSTVQGDLGTIASPCDEFREKFVYT
jgi:hypothetical protein